MNQVGFLLVTDSVSGMTRDNVNLEDRVIADIRSHIPALFVLGRTVNAKNTKFAAREFRNDAHSNGYFSSRLDKSFCYILLGNTEKNYGLKSNFWFKNQIMNIVNESLFLGYEPVIVFSTEEHFTGGSRSYSSDGKNKIIRVPKGDDWSVKCRSALKDVSSETNSRIIESKLHCPKQWDTPDLQSIKAMSKLIAEDIRKRLDFRLKKKQDAIKPKKKSVLVFSTSQ